ncbi:MAG: hypothetical protein JNJ41_14500 [Bacteroidia bacterium]|nr:hypothetical protein [Bacteroidia bacterium]
MGFELAAFFLASAKSWSLYSGQTVSSLSDSIMELRRAQRVVSCLAVVNKSLSESITLCCAIVCKEKNREIIPGNRYFLISSIY